jgi:phenylpyruvate tautomerase PptA (4-oxalocrotonate tautomerase family)
LEKEPGKRYPTAQAVADDLNRFLSGEPIGARATSSLERAVKWVKRNKGLAAAVSGVTLALLLGTTVSIAFGLEAKKQAKAAGEAAEREREEAARADQERSTAIDARNDLKKSNDDLLGALANAFLGPIQANGREDGLTPYEVEAFWGIASRRDGPVAFRFLEAATHSPLASRQFENRAEYTLHAAIGLDRELCDKAVRHLTEQLNTTNFPSNQQRALALTCSRMEGGSAAFAVRIVTALVEAMANTKDEVALQQLGKGLVAVVERLSPDDASCSAVAKTLTDSIARSNGSALRELAGGVAALAERLSPDDAARLANRLTEAMARTTDPQDLHPLARALVAVARRLSPDEATRIYSAAAKTLTASTAKTKSSKLRELTEGFAALSERLSPDNAARLANTITAATAKTTNTDPLRKLVAVADERLSSDEATRLTRSLTDAIAKATDPQGLRPLAKGLTVLSGRPLPFDGARIRSTAAKTITDAMAKTTNSDALRKFAAGLAVMAERFPPDEAASACFTAAKILTDAMANATDPYDQHQLAKGLAAVARWVSPDDAARLAKTLTDAMAKTTNSDTLRELAGGVAAVVSRMSPELATRILLDSMLSEGTRPVLAKTLRTFACGLPMLERERVGLLAVGGFGSSCGVLSELPLLRLDFHPQGKPLPAQPLVELLKHPFCVGEPRRAVLDALEFTYNRRFADQWGFVQFVRDNKLPLDLLTPPKRSKP